ncbi:Conjugal transfer protein [Pseudomonas sp. 8Z]|uniref:TIGR03750 family conjugal transfer protein n=1 Tax=Pseudomonas sp. 8Z TaxID=2653166 RepID=UPI0012EFBFF5|nr:TIGR03750 family conjugal transfer protein [Pseudomonas sp. 8Z]VXC23242.1 Conjugal transfer protein [Pseudomonas sp. 8Z]
MSEDRQDDGTLSFLPVRLNNQPVVMGGLTADEMWTTVLLSGGAGFVIGTPVAIATQIWALIIGGALLGGVFGLLVASRILRRMKRGRPDTWFYRQVQLSIAQYMPSWSSAGLITRSGAWTCHRTE